MRWLKLALACLVLGGFMLAMLRPPMERFWLLAAVWAAWMHWTSGVLIIGLARVMRLSLPPEWHRLRAWESDGSFYRRLGIVRYQEWLLASPSGPNPFQTFKGHRSQVPELRKFTCNAEMGHLTLLFVSVIVTGVALALGRTWTAFFLTLVNVPWNLYPVMLQRYTRSRILRIQERSPRQKKIATNPV